MESSQSVPEQPQAQPQDFSQTDLDPNPQPNDPPAFVPDPRDNGCSCARLTDNLPYFKTALGILKIVSVALGFIALVLTIFAYFKSTYAQQRGSLFNEGQLKSGPDPCHRSNTTFCDQDTYFKDRLCEKGRNVKTCIVILLASIPLKLVFFVWLGTVCNLIRMVIVLRDHLTSRAFYRIDTYCNLCAAIAIIVAALMLIAYFVQVIKEDLCDKTNLKTEATDYVINNGPNPNSNSSIPSPSTTNSSDEMKIEKFLADLTKRCPEIQLEKYYHWHFLFGGIFAITTGIVCIVIAIVSIKQSRHSLEPARMVMGPNGPQLYDPSMTQVQVQSATNLSPSQTL